MSEVGLSHLCLKFSRLHQLVLLIRTVLRWRWIWSFGGRIFDRVGIASYYFLHFISEALNIPSSDFRGLVIGFLEFLVFLMMSEEMARCINPQPGGSGDFWSISHDNKKLRTRSMEKQRGMAFGFRKTATAFKKTGQTDRQRDRQTDRQIDR